MSKTSQRKRDAYAKGYRVGRYGLWDNSRGYHFRVAVGGAFERGRADGRRDREIVMEGRWLRQAWWRRLLVWLGSKWG